MEQFVYKNYIKLLLRKSKQTFNKKRNTALNHISTVQKWWGGFVTALPSGDHSRQDKDAKQRSQPLTLIR